MMLDLPLGNRTTDTAIIDFATLEQRVVVTKDDDFVQSFYVMNKPDKLLLIATGNIGNDALEKLVSANLNSILQAFETARFVELNRVSLMAHE